MKTTLKKFIPLTTQALKAGVLAASLCLSPAIAGTTSAGTMLIKPQTATFQSGSYPLANQKLYVDPYSQAAAYARSGAQGKQLESAWTIATQPTALWVGNWNTNVYADVYNYVKRAHDDGGMPVLALYNIPQRDCGGYSDGGADVAAYPGWIEQVALAIGSEPTAVILEPDALAQIDQPGCLTDVAKAKRYELLQLAISTLKNRAANANVYLDAGHPNWISANNMAQYLKNAGIAAADGFALNVSNFMTTESNVAYGNQLSALAGGKHFVVDTSRNGSGPASDGQWCNPAGRTLGAAPQGFSSGLVDAYLWIKRPGESDGSCRGGPGAGIFWPQFAYELTLRPNR